ncbi:phosphatidylserine/phosphatidylglycerophosphate/cardiolipin synthase family protein [Actinomadura sp. 9N407]|uniref:phosphatidylserine/phosphatidylglycerophosphate/ cardiolipin synthase family protein n=1 Tax=Actinomadura sp. 9N407 TaxID=3375154 RepID=UPI0037B8AF9F
MLIRSLALAALSAASLVAVTGTPAHAATPCADAPASPVRTQAVFNDASKGDGAEIVQEICKLIHAAPAGSTIRVAHFVMSGAAGADFAGELIKAHGRRVNVQVILDGDLRNTGILAQLTKGLGTDESARSWVHSCTGPMSGGTAACVGDKGQHNKFYVFSETGGKREVVVQSSANLTNLNTTTYWNNAVTMVGNRHIYRAYDSYFHDLAAERKNPDHYTVTTGRSRDGMMRSHFFPRAGTGPSTDTVVELLDPVVCGSRKGRTEIRIGMSEWDAYRIGIADRLKALAAQGCRISVVHGPMDTEVAERLAPAGIDLDVLDGSTPAGRIHSKYMLIEGTYGRDQKARMVFTGSHNYNQTSLRRNDDTLLEIDNPEIYTRYRTNFETLRSQA